MNKKSTSSKIAIKLKERNIDAKVGEKLDQEILI